MNVLYICHYAGSLDLGMAFRPYYLAREWQKQGHKVRIVSASFSHLRVKNPVIQKDFELQDIDGIQYQWIKTSNYNHNGVARAWTIVQFCGKLWWNAKEIAEKFKPDVVITSSTYPMDTWPAQRIVKYSGAKLIHENHDLWPLTLTTIGHMSQYHPFVLLCGWALESAIKHSDEIVCLLPYAYEYFQQFGLKKLTKFHHIPNGVALQDWEHPEPLPKEHQDLFDSLKEKFIVLYTGGHALSNALNILIDVAEKLKNQQNIAFVLVGKGVEKKKIQEYVKKKGCSNVFFLDGVSKKAVPMVLQQGDLLYVGFKTSELNKYGCSLNKMYDYMLSGTPIVQVGRFRNEEVLDAKAGSVLYTDDAAEIAAEIMRYFNMDHCKLIDFGSNGRKWVLANCEYSVLAKKFEGLFV